MAVTNAFFSFLSWERKQTVHLPTGHLPVNTPSYDWNSSTDAAACGSSSPSPALSRALL